MDKVTMKFYQDKLKDEGFHEACLFVESLKFGKPVKVDKVTDFNKPEKGRKG